jgi:hypothetical protein
MEPRTLDQSATESGVGSLGLRFGLGGALDQLAVLLGDLVRMYVVLLSQLGQRALVTHGGQRHLGLEGG